MTEGVVTVLRKVNVAVHTLTMRNLSAALATNI